MKHKFIKKHKLHLFDIIEQFEYMFFPGGNIMRENEIRVIIKSNNVILEFPKCEILTSAFIGKNGYTKNKEEGDGCTPIGKFSLGLMLGTHSNILNEKYNYIKINNNMYWIDDSNSKYYNRLVDVTKVKRDWNSAEHLADYPVQYEYLIEIKINELNNPNKGSAIFLHCSNGESTQGCIAINNKVMKKIVENINENTKINIILQNK